MAIFISCIINFPEVGGIREDRNGLLSVNTTSGFFMEAIMDRVMSKEDEGQYDEYINEDKQHVSRWFHLGASMVFINREWSRRHLEQEHLYALFGNKVIAWKLFEILYSDGEVVKQLYELIDKLFQEECSRYRWRPYEWAAKELDVPLGVVEVFASARFIRATVIDGKTLANGADVSAVKILKNEFPDEYSMAVKDALAYLKETRRERAIAKVKNRERNQGLVICG